MNSLNCDLKIRLTVLYRKNNFAEISKNLNRYRDKNNFVDLSK